MSMRTTRHELGHPTLTTHISRLAGPSAAETTPVSDYQSHTTRMVGFTATAPQVEGVEFIEDFFPEDVQQPLEIDQ